MVNVGGVYMLFYANANGLPIKKVCFYTKI